MKNRRAEREVAASTVSRSDRSRALADSLRGVQMAREPVASKMRDLFERSWFFEEMGRTGNDLEPDLATHLFHGVPVHLDHWGIEPPHDQHGRCLDLRQHL